MSTGSGKVLTRELFEVIKAEIYSRLGETLHISDKISVEGFPCLQILGMRDGRLYPRSLCLSTSDMIVYQSILLGDENCITNFKKLFIHVAVDIEALFKLTTWIQNKKRRAVVYFNGFDRTDVQERLSKLNHCEHLVLAIWLNSSERAKLREAALFHNFKKEEVYSSQLNRKIESLMKENKAISEENLVIREENSLIFEENKAMGSKIIVLEAENQAMGSKIMALEAENEAMGRKLDLVLQRLGLN